MISALMLINQKGEVVIYRLYRDDVNRDTADAFRMQVVAKKDAGGKPPVRMVDGITFMHIRHEDLYFVAVTRSNVNPSLVFQFLFQLKSIFAAYLGESFDEGSVKNNFTLVYELLDESLDFGYPQNCSIDVLKLYINLGKIKSKIVEHSQLTSQITGAIDWRKPDIKYKKNQVYIDILESVNLLLSADQNVLKADVSGKVMMKAYVSGMPECQFGLNDKIILDKQSTQNNKRKGVPSVNIDDCTFHRCVRLGKFDADRTITFIPPDGEFELMRYRISQNVNLPFRVIPVVEEKGKTRVYYNIKVAANFSSKLTATNVIFKIPCPPTTARANINVPVGKAKYDPAQRAIVWKISKVVGRSEFSFIGEVELMASTREKAWPRPPIQVEFQVPMFTASGLKVLFLKVLLKGVKTVKWVRYVTRAGQYQIRI